MAKQTYKIKESIRNLATRIDARLDMQADHIQEMANNVNCLREILTVQKLSKPSLALDQTVLRLNELFEPARAARTKKQVSRNTPEKKRMRRDWCSKISVIRMETDVPVDSLTVHRAGQHARNKNWRSIQNAAGLEISNDNNKQDLPLVGTIAVYCLRLRLQVRNLEHEANIEQDEGVAKFYNERASRLLEIYYQIKRAYPKYKISDTI